MKIAFVVEYYHPHVGGLEVMFQHLAEGMVSLGHDVTVWTSSLPGSPAREVSNGVCIQRIRLPSFGTRYWFTFVAPFVLLRALRRCDIVHTTTYNAALPAWICAKVNGKRSVLTVHEVWGKLWFRLRGMPPLPSMIHWLFEQIVLRFPFDAYVGISASTTRAIKQIYPVKRRVVRIYHGIDYDFFERSKYDGSRVRQRLGLGSSFSYLYYGRPGWAKGIESLLDAVPLVTRQLPDAKLLLLLSRDPRPPYNRLQQQIERLQIQRQVMVLDSVARVELPNYIIAADCVVVPSLSEGFGFSAAESCALEVPVAVSRAGSLPEVVSGRVRFFEPGNPSSIADAIVAIARGQTETLPAKHFSWQESLQAYADLYHSLVNPS